MRGTLRERNRCMPRSMHMDAAHYLPRQLSLPALHEAAAGCRACPLHKLGTQTVFGQGAERARVVLVGEQPGHEEDLAGRPFVGPAGRLLDRALEDAGIVRADAYVTNVVKHFKWTSQGKRRLHQRPNASEIEACRPWLDAELALIKPEVLVCLGATAAQALLGRSFRVTQQRGIALTSELARHVLATVHPSSILRSRSSEEREAAYGSFVADLRVVAKLLAGEGAAPTPRAPARVPAKRRALAPQQRRRAG
jgi:uracil-DNA glycosylase family protein